MHWVFGFNAKNLIFRNKTMVLFELLPCVLQPTITIKGGKPPPKRIPVAALNFFNTKKPN